jgi:hypothetical protein
MLDSETTENKMIAMLVVYYFHTIAGTSNDTKASTNFVAYMVELF